MNSLQAGEMGKFLISFVQFFLWRKKAKACSWRELSIWPKLNRSSMQHFWRKQCFPLSLFALVNKNPRPKLCIKFPLFLPPSVTVFFQFILTFDLIEQHTHTHDGQNNGENRGRGWCYKCNFCLLGSIFSTLISVHDL